MADPRFEMFTLQHYLAMGSMASLIVILFIIRNTKQLHQTDLRHAERFFAVTLVIMELFYHFWMITKNRWHLYDSLPLELCSLSLIASVVLLWTGNRHVFDFVFYAGIGGAVQAIATPVLDMGFPHFRYFHFFYTHLGIILTALYFVWVKGYRPTFRGVIKTLIVLNVLLPIIVLVNRLVNGNYMFLQSKPESGSLLDMLGPYPWYIVSLEAVAFSIFTLLWLLFRKIFQ